MPNKDNSTGLTRRQAIVLTGTGMATGLAGCGGGDGTPTDGGTPGGGDGEATTEGGTPTATATATSGSGGGSLSETYNSGSGSIALGPPHTITAMPGNYGALYASGAFEDGMGVSAKVTDFQNGPNYWTTGAVIVANDMTTPGGDMVYSGIKPRKSFVNWGDYYLGVSTEAGGTGTPCENVWECGKGKQQSTTPSWIRLERSGSEFTAKYKTSQSGSWTTIASTSISAAADAQDVGIALISPEGNADKDCCSGGVSAGFDDVTIESI